MTEEIKFEQSSYGNLRGWLMWLSGQLIDLNKAEIACDLRACVYRLDDLLTNEQQGVRDE